MQNLIWPKLGPSLQSYSKVQTKSSARLLFMRLLAAAAVDCATIIIISSTISVATLIWAAAAAEEAPEMGANPSIHDGTLT